MPQKAAEAVLAGLIALALLGALAIDQKAAVGGGFFGDESVYFGAAQSLAYDFDLRYSRADLVRISRDWEAGPSGLVLQKSGGALIYAKPYLYALIAALPCRLFGAGGILALNMLLLGAVVVSAYRYLLRFNPPAPALAFALGFFGLSTAYLYAWWMHPEVLQLALVFFALRFYLAAREEHAAAPVRLELLSGLLFALAIFAKPTNVAFLLLPAFDLIRGPRRGAGRIGAGAVLGLAALVLVGYALTGSLWAYGGERKRFEAVVPFQSERYTFDAFGTQVATQEAQERTWGWPVLPRNLAYFLVGRFTGVLPYAPLVLAALLLFGLRRPREPRRGVLLIALTLYALGLLVLIPENYHGGGGAIGNRWFLGLLPGFLFLVREIRPRWPAVVFGAAGAVFLAPLLTNPLFAAARPGHHATRAPFTALPLELTLTVNWPTNTDPTRYRLRFPDHLVYLADYDAWAEPDGRLALRGAATAELALRGPQLGAQLLVEVENGPVRNRIELEVDGRGARFELEPGARAAELISGLEPLVIGSSRLLLLKASTSAGGIPRYLGAPAGAEHRYLGAYLRLSVAPQRIVERLYARGRWKDLVRALAKPPAAPDAFYLVRAAQALERTGDQAAAKRYAARADEQLPGLLNALRAAIPASLAPANTIVVEAQGSIRSAARAAPIPLAADRSSAGLLLLRELPPGAYRLDLAFAGIAPGSALQVAGYLAGAEQPSAALGARLGDAGTARFTLTSRGEARWVLSLKGSDWSATAALSALRLTPILREPTPP